MTLGAGPTVPARPEAKRISLRRASVWAVALVTVDAFYLNEGWLAAIVGLGMLLGSPSPAAIAKHSEQSLRHLARVAIFLAAALLVFGLNWANNLIAERRFEMLITSIKAFKHEHQRYPAKLDELVPEFLDHVPRAKYTLGFSAFHYDALPDYHNLFYVETPPFGRPAYKFEKNERWYLD